MDYFELKVRTLSTHQPRLIKWLISKTIHEIEAQQSSIIIVLQERKKSTTQGGANEKKLAVIQ